MQALGKVNAMTGPRHSSSVEPRDRLRLEAALRTAVTAAFCSFLLIKLAAPEVLDTRLSIGSQLVLLGTVLSLAAAAAAWFVRRAAAGPHDTSP